MVAKINLPEIDSVQIISRISDERTKHREFYDRIKPAWVAGAQLYIENKGCPITLIPLNLRDYTNDDEEAAARKCSLINLYSPSENQFQYEILSTLRRDHQLIFCPSCGAHTVPGTLDHYLPKTSFPEFAVLIANLTPMCNACQEAKGASYLTEENKKRFIHSYYDPIDFPIYKLEISGNLNKPKFKFEFEEEIPDDLLELVKEHVSSVNIKPRFLSYCETKYVHLLKTANGLRLRGNQDSLELILSTFLQNAELNSANCWEAVFYRAAIKERTLIDHLKNGELPANL